MTIAELASKVLGSSESDQQLEEAVLERSVAVFSGSGYEKQELETLRQDRDKLVHQIGEQAVPLNF